MRLRKFTITAIVPVVALLVSSTGLIASFVWSPNTSVSFKDVKVSPAISAIASSDSLNAIENEQFENELFETALPDNLGENFRSHKLRMTADGFVTGRVGIINPSSGDLSSLNDMKVLFVRKGQIIKTVKPEVGGVFQASGLNPGMYSVIAASPEGFYAVAVDVVPPLNSAELNSEDGTTNVNFQEESAVLTLNAPAVPAADFPALKELLEIYVPNLKTPAGVPTSPVSFQPEKSTAPPTPETPEILPAPASQPATTITGRSVLLTGNGDLQGRVRRFHPDTRKPLRIRRMNVFLIRNGKIVGQAPIRENGNFTVRNVSPGVQSVVCAGLDGLAAFSIHAVPFSGTQTASTEKIPHELVFAANNILQPGSGAAAGAMSQEDAQVAKNELNNASQGDNGDGGGDGAGDGGTGDGGTGDGGTGTSGGGAPAGDPGIGGALLGAGLGAALGAALSDDDNGVQSVFIVNP